MAARPEEVQCLPDEQDSGKAKDQRRSRWSGVPLANNCIECFPGELKHGVEPPTNFAQAAALKPGTSSIAYICMHNHDLKHLGLVEVLLLVKHSHSFNAVYGAAIICYYQSFYTWCRRFSHYLSGGNWGMMSRALLRCRSCSCPCKLTSKIHQ